MMMQDDSSCNISIFLYICYENVANIHVPSLVICYRLLLKMAIEIVDLP